MLLSNAETWLALLLWVSKNPSYIYTTLNVMGGFLLFFDVTMDISYGKLISRKLPITRTTPFTAVKGSFATVRVSHVTAPYVLCENGDCLPFTKNFRLTRLERKWKTTSWIVPTENFWEQGIYIWKCSPVFREGICQSEIRVPFLQSHLWYQFQAFASFFSINGTDLYKW